MNFGNVGSKLLLDHFGNIFGIAGVTAKKNAYSCHEFENLLNIKDMFCNRII